MTGSPEPAGVDAKVAGLLRWYPRAWRARYGAEFGELLAAEFAERPRSLRRSADIAASGVRARLADAGLTSHGLDQRTAARAGLATLACCAAAFVLIGLALWSQLAIGVSWAQPRHDEVTQAADLMGGVLALFFVLTVAAGISAAGSIVRTIRLGGGRELLSPAALIATGAGVLIAGGRHFANAWPGTGGHLLVQQSLVPAGVAAFCWAVTMWITSYAAHPAALLAFPAGQLAWMALSPAAACCVTVGVARLLRRLDQSPRALRGQLWLGRAVGAAMLVFIAGALRWLASPGAGVMPAFHVGSIDLAGISILLVAAVATSVSTRRLEPCPAA